MTWKLPLNIGTEMCETSSKNEYFLLSYINGFKPFCHVCGLAVA